MCNASVFAILVFSIKYMKYTGKCVLQTLEKFLSLLKLQTRKTGLTNDVVVIYACYIL